MDLLLRAPFLTGYGVEIGMMIDVLRRGGLTAMAQVDLGTRQNRHQPLWDLTRMSSAVLRRWPAGVAAREGSLGPGTPGANPAYGTSTGPETYLHAVATANGLRLDEHLNELLSARPWPRSGRPSTTRRRLPDRAGVTGRRDRCQFDDRESHPADR